MKLRIIYKLLVIITLFFTILFLPRLIFDYDPTLIRQSQLFTIVRILLLLILFSEISLFFFYQIIKTSLKNWLKNLGALLYTILAFFILLEGIFMFVPKSHFAGIPLCTKIWFYRYWKPINIYGFRDNPVAKNKKIYVFTLGDSFTAGHGLNKIDYRYSNILDKSLQKQFADLQVLNLGVNGADTRDEYNTMIRFIKESGVKPGFIVLQYFGNDIEKIAKKNGIQFTGFDSYADLPRGVDQIVKSSYFFNYFYWLFPHGDVKSYITFLDKAYHDENSFNEHLQDFDSFYSYSQDHNIPLLILFFPFMQDLKFSEDLYIKRLSDYCQSKSIPFIDITKLVSDIPLKDRVVNINDGHSSQIVNKRIADSIDKYILNKKVF